MRKIVFVLMLILPVIAMASDKVVVKTFEVDSGARLSLECYKGEIKIRTGDVSSIQMHARIYPDEGPVSDLEHVMIETSGRGDYVHIEVEYDEDAMKSRNSGDGLLSSWNGTSLPFVDFDIIVPQDASLSLESHKSTFDVQAPSGEVMIDTHKGHGKVVGVRGDFGLSTHKGEFDVEVDLNGDLELETHKGKINVIINGADNFRLRGETHDGDLDFEGFGFKAERVEHWENGDHHSSEDSYVSETIGGGKHRIDIETHKGRIKLDFRR